MGSCWAYRRLAGKPDHAHRFGQIEDTVVGMIGALVGGIIFEQFGEAEATGINIWSIFVAFLGQ